MMYTYFSESNIRLVKCVTSFQSKFHIHISKVCICVLFPWSASNHQKWSFVSFYSTADTYFHLPTHKRLVLQGCHFLSYVYVRSLRTNVNLPDQKHFESEVQLLRVHMHTHHKWTRRRVGHYSNKCLFEWSRIRIANKMKLFKTNESFFIGINFS